MTTFPGFRAAFFIMALAAVSAAVSVPTAQSVPLSEGSPASGGTVPQSGTCPAGGQQDEHCLPGGPGSPPGSNSTPPPPVTPPTMPPVTFPIVPPPGIQPEELPKFIWGRAKAMLHIKDNDQDVTYWSNEAYLLFFERPVQDMPGNTQYLLYPAVLGEQLSMTWTVKGTVFDCTVEGQAKVIFPVEPDPNNPNQATLLDPTKPLNVTQPAFGYMNVVGPDGGDYHSVMVKAFDADARYTKTCPGDPPVVTKEPFEAGYLLHIVWQKNTDDRGYVRFKGTQSFDGGDPLDFLKLLPPGAAGAIPPGALQALQASGTGTSRRYTWEWELVRVRGSASE